MKTALNKIFNKVLHKLGRGDSLLSGKALAAGA